MEMRTGDTGPEPDSGGSAEPRRRDRRSRRAVIVTASAAALLSFASASGASGAGGAGILTGGEFGPKLDCGGILFPAAALPGRTVGADELAGPAEGISQLLRLSEWSRQSPYDGARWSVVPAGEQAAVLVARLRNGPVSYTPVRRRTDGHWQIDTPCRPRPAR